MDAATTLGAAAITFFVLLIGIPILGSFLKLFGFYTIVNEGYCNVYVLFGQVLGVIKEPGLHILPSVIGWRAFIVGLFGKCYVLDMRLDQTYLRSNPVNSEEGAPMGIGIWYEMFICDPVSYLFKNADPQGSLAANVSNATVRSLSNLPLAELLEDRHTMSQAVRAEVTTLSQEWGYKLGSVYIRKVHFRDTGMMQQIEAKVVNRLRQVTAAITQDGTNQVNIITSTADREAATEFAKAKAVRPQIVGKALETISQDPAVSSAMFDILETQKLIDGGARVMFVPPKTELLSDLLTAQGAEPPTKQSPPKTK
jgi:regulator of protease activity HflC (stomatin/prohibitin superfamily)